MSFQRKVVEELEGGRFGSLEEARTHYEIGGTSTIQTWLKLHGKNRLLPKVVRVERPDEKDRMRELRRRVEELERALGRTQAEKVLGESYLELACERLGEEVDAFKKGSAGKRCIGRMGADDPSRG